MRFRSIASLRVLGPLLLGAASVGSAPVEIKALGRALGMGELVFKPEPSKTRSLADLLKTSYEPASVSPKPQLRLPEKSGAALHDLLESSHPRIDWRPLPEGAFDGWKPPDTAGIRTAQVLLSQIGYYRGRFDGIAGPQTRRAVQSFHRASGRRSDGSLTRYTITALFLAALKDFEHTAPEIRPEAERQLSRCLAKIGFADVIGGVPCVVAKFEAYIGVPQTAQISREIVSRIEDDLILRDELASTRRKRVLGLAPEQFFSRRGEVFGFLGDDSQRFLLVRPNAPELWVLDNQGQVVQRTKGPTGVEEFYEAGRQIAVANSDGHALFLYASPAKTDGNGTIALQIGREAQTVSRAKFDDFMQSGRGLSKLDEAIGTGRGERKALFVLDSGIFRTAAGSSESTDEISTSSTRLAAVLRTRYRHVADVFLAKDGRAARENARKLLPITQPADLAVYTAPGGTDFGAIQNLKKPLMRAGIRVVDEAGYREIPGTNLLIITGHRDQTMSDQLQKLKRAGVLKGKLVALISCSAPGAEALQSGLMVGPLSAAGVLFFSDAINATAVAAVMRELSRIVGSQHFLFSTLPELLQQSVDAALERAETAFEKQEIEKMRSLVDQRSMLRRSGAESEPAA